jgi:microcystin-dependent protein
MTTITTINATDRITDSRADINNNFSALNTDKIETSVLDTDTTLAANSDSKVATQKAVRAYVDALGGQTYLVPTGGILPYAGSAAPANFLLCDGSAVSRTTYATLFGVISTTFGVGNGSTTFNLPDLRNRVPMGAGTGTKVATFASRASNVITVTGLSDAANNEFQTGQAVLYSAPSGAMTGLSDNTTYYLIKTGNLTFSLATSVANANAGIAISLSSDGTGTQTFTLTFTTRTLGNTGGEENHALTDAEMPSHTHTSNAVQSSGSNGAGTAGNSSYGAATINATGSDTVHNILNPFVVINYIIKT